MRVTTPHKLRTTGLFYAGLVFAAAILNFIYVTTNGKSIHDGLLDFRNVLSLLLVALLLFLSAYLRFLAWLQPAVFLALTPFPLMTGGPNSFFGLGFFAIGILLLFKLEFFSKLRILKTLCCIGYLSVIEVYAGLRQGSAIYYALTPVLFIIAFLVFLYLAFRDKVVVYLTKIKPTLSLEAKGLSDAEQVYILGLLKGHSTKVASTISGVSESTVRNTLARAYKKLGITNKAGLFRLARDFNVVK